MRHSLEIQRRYLGCPYIACIKKRKEKNLLRPRKMIYYRGQRSILSNLYIAIAPWRRLAGAGGSEDESRPATHDLSLSYKSGAGGRAWQGLTLCSVHSSKVNCEIELSSTADTPYQPGYKPGSHYISLPLGPVIRREELGSEAAEHNIVYKSKEYQNPNRTHDLARYLR